VHRRAQGFRFLAVASDARYIEQMAGEILRRWNGSLS